MKTLDTAPMIHNTNIRKDLIARRSTLREEIRATLLRADAERYAQIADRIGDTDDRSLTEVLAQASEAEAARDIGEITDIDLALQRLTNGTYGRCIVCHGEIPGSRLNVYPTAKRCLPCQKIHEHSRK